MEIEKNELIEILENGMTVGQLILNLEDFDKNLLVVNTRDKFYLPVAEVKETNIDYCLDEVISKKVVSIW